MAEDQQQDTDESIDADGWYCPVGDPLQFRGLVRKAPQSIYDYARDFFLHMEHEYFIDVTVRLDRSAISGKIDKRLAAQLAEIVRSGLQGQVPHSWRPGDAWFADGLKRYPHIRREIKAVAYWRAERLKYFIDGDAKRKICKAFAISERTFEDEWHPKNRVLAEQLVEAILLADPAILDQNTMSIFERYLLGSPTPRSRKIGPQQPE